MVNVAALLYLTGKAETLKEGAKQVQTLLSSGQAMNTLNAIIEVSNG